MIPYNDYFSEGKLSIILDIHFLSQICQHFLNAVEDSRFGWFWECPNGTTCSFRHAVPEGKLMGLERTTINLTCHLRIFFCYSIIQ